MRYPPELEQLVSILMTEPSKLAINRLNTTLKLDSIKKQNLRAPLLPVMSVWLCVLVWFFVCTHIIYTTFLIWLVRLHRLIISVQFSTSIHKLTCTCMLAFYTRTYMYRLQNYNVQGRQLSRVNATAYIYIYIHIVGFSWWKWCLSPEIIVLLPVFLVYKKISSLYWKNASQCAIADWPCG